jgi:hypothetical protein
MACLYQEAAGLSSAGMINGPESPQPRHHDCLSIRNMVDMVAMLRYHRRHDAHAESHDVVQADLEHWTVPSEGVSTKKVLLEEEHLLKR